MDKEVSNEFQKILTKQGIQFKLNNKVTAVSNINDKVIVDYTNNKTGAREKKECDKVLVSVGRKPYTEGLNLSKLGVKKDSKGRIEVNEKFFLASENRKKLAEQNSQKKLNEEFRIHWSCNGYRVGYRIGYSFSWTCGNNNFFTCYYNFYYLAKKIK